MKSRHRRPSRRVFLLRRALVGAVALFILISGYSYINALAAPGGAGFGVTSVEWIRGHGGASLVGFIENTWYSLNKPKVGGKPPKGAFKIKGRSHATGAVNNSVPYLPAPKPITPLAFPSIQGEGQWTPEGLTVDGHPGLYVTLLRPDPIHTSLIAAVAWMDPHILSFDQFAGYQEPTGGGTWKYESPIPTTMRSNLVAAFNSGFRLNDAQGGYYAYGRTAQALVNGAASFVIYKNGAVNIASWSGGSNIPSNVDVVRQNLSLIVNNGKINPKVYDSNYAEWGLTVGNQVLVWRSGVGITSNGAIVYVAGPGLSISSLANLLVKAGAVRAMELDINTDWVNFFYFNQQPGTLASPANGSQLLLGMLRPVSRYFSISDRDFVAAFARTNPVSLPMPSATIATPSPAASSGRSKKK
ncbi:MAG: phosphodiester glycosidase family protein [Acidimicrobiales bacterium]